jgi:transcriptional regulator with XRE-family HTH domain
MINRKELLQTNEYWLERIQNDLFHQIDLYLTKNGKNQNDLAKQLGVGKSYISQILNGNFDHKLSKLIELSLAIGLAPQVGFKPIDEIIEEEEQFIQDCEYALHSESDYEYESWSVILEGRQFQDYGNDTPSRFENGEFSMSA